MSKELILKLRVYYEDTDAAGVVYHSNYLNFMERARSEFLISLDGVGEDRPIFVVSKVEIEYLIPAKLYDILIVRSKIAKLGGASMVFEHIISSDLDDKKIFCRGFVTVVSINKNHRPCRIPKNIACSI